jgi:hypothetical protein
MRRQLVDKRTMFSFNVLFLSLFILLPLLILLRFYRMLMLAC